ncbi:hypothetical protein CY652_10680 [Burkholderia sp. WAC0059]|uniref:hypothetical protein n=1 Tax=Burkholderia sp. WAC0059 TaxID=2066022 RepID=UPI000C7F2193|nr:hypothetical protein [Burkholderia sp. WAC0059]PLZ02566.1 hypothetical protein CY652_10680 [Burkholderia sp. WAC0059]
MWLISLPNGVSLATPFAIERFRDLQIDALIRGSYTRASVVECLRLAEVQRQESGKCSQQTVATQGQYDYPELSAQAHPAERHRGQHWP